MDAEKEACLILALARGIRPADIRALLDGGESLSDVVASRGRICHAQLDPGAVKRLLGLGVQLAELKGRAEQVLAWCSEHQIHCLTFTDPSYPPLLKEISAAPAMLFVRGDPGLLAMPQLAMVGSRNASPQGLRDAEQFGRVLAASGFVVTSGMALGIDGAAHRGAIRAGKTLSVLGTGLDVIYPRQHKQLYGDIVDAGGAIVSEFLPGTSAMPANFPRRNRVISGLSLGVLVVEAALKSGSLITARYAMEQNREVFALPGSIHNPMCKGNHQLLKQGATLVESVDDVVEQLGGMLGYLAEDNTDPSMRVVEDSGEEQVLLSAMGFEAVDMDRLVARTGLPVRDVTRMLMLLELDGKVVSINGGYQRLD